LNKSTFSQIEAYMLACMRDSAHDREHVVRVLYFAMDIAKFERVADTDVLIAACLLHDIGRPEQYADPALGHEEVGSQKAYDFLLKMRWPVSDAAHVKACIATHRFRSDCPPATVEARILFDADKLDAAGALGVGRTLLYQGIVGQPLYSLDAQGNVSDGSADSQPSFFHEYKYKLEKLYDRFYTQRGKQIASERMDSAAAFYNNLLGEVRACYANGKQELKKVLKA
jgi:uncharacterized protein